VYKAASVGSVLLMLHEICRDMARLSNPHLAAIDCEDELPVAGAAV